MERYEVKSTELHPAFDPEQPDLTAVYLATEVDPMRSRLVEAETALLNAMMGNANGVAAYLIKYPAPYSGS